MVTCSKGYESNDADGMIKLLGDREVNQDRQRVINGRHVMLGKEGI